ncbi:MAG: nuclear transport factor 2 family protein [Saprospiraceae bacterium]|nr:nuclear transport factor 2 family protein [Saprospiraceae bacterium]
MGEEKYLLRLERITGTHKGSFMGIPPTGKAVKWMDADVVQLNSVGKCFSHEITNTGEVLVQIGQASMLNPNTQVVMQAYEKFGKGDIPGLLALCDDKVMFNIEDAMFDSKPRMFNGKAEVGKFFEELGAKIRYSKFQPTRFVADGDDVFISVAAEYTDAAGKQK